MEVLHVEVLDVGVINVELLDVEVLEKLALVENMCGELVLVEDALVLRLMRWSAAGVGACTACT